MNYIGMKTLIWREIERFTRVAIQSLVSPWINALLYIFIFGFVVGGRISLIAGVPYINFVLPGILMLNLITSAFSQTSFSLYFQRFARHIEELLVAPFSHIELIIAYVIGGLARGVAVGLGIYAIAIFFGAASVHHPILFLLTVLAVCMIFSFVGLLVALWSDNFEQLNVLNTFVIMPFTFLGGVFNSITMLPAKMQWVVKFNPFFYFVDSLRYSMIGVREGSALVGAVIMVGLMFGLGFWTWILFARGWRLRS